MSLEVLMFGWEFPPHNSGGLGVACQGIAHALNDRGVDVKFVLPKTVDIDDEKLEFKFADGASGPVEIETIETLISSPYTTEKEYQENRKKLEAQGKEFGRTLIEEVQRYGQKAAGLAQQADSDVIHAHDWLSFPAGLTAKRYMKKPLVSHVHATEFDRSGGQGVNPPVYDIEKQGVLGADHVLSVSGLIRDTLINNHGVPKDSVSVAHNGMDQEEKEKLEPILKQHKKNGGKVILFLGRQTIQKGPDYFLQAARKLSDIRSDTIFIMAGSGDMQNQLMHEASALGIGDKTLFPGFVRGKKVDRLYQSADLYVMPSVSEPFGLTPLESLQNNTPTLISKQSGVSEVLTHALKVDFWDTRKMADRMNSVLDHPALYNNLRENGHKQLPDINWDKTAQSCINCYTKLLAV